MKTIFLSLLLLLGFSADKTPAVDRNEAKLAYTLLNKIRKNPSAFKKELPFLASLKAIHQLRWNDTLAQVAEAKTLDMATNNYFAHVDGKGYGMNYYIHKAGYTLKPDWLKKPTANYFESCNGGAQTGEEAIKMLLIDADNPDLGHRIHLMGLNAWTASLVDIGIGYVRSNAGTAYRSYTCIIIAKHQ